MKVSVCIITFNHKAFIRQALDSVLMQQVTFDFEIVVGDDHSTDGTREILDSYSQKYPHRIRMITGERNIGASENLARTYQACTGDYVATMDGDDYMTCPTKLQEQADFLDQHPACVACFHALRVVGASDGSEFIHRPGGRKRLCTLKDFSLGLVIHPVALMFRRQVVAFPEWLPVAPVGDWPFQALHAQFGDFGFIDKVMGVYRIHERGITVQMGLRGRYERVLETYLKAHEIFLEHCEPRFRTLLLRGLYARFYALAHAYCDRGDFEKALELAKRIWKERGYDPRMGVFEPVKIYTNIYLPSLYGALKKIALLRGGGR